MKSCFSAESTGNKLKKLTEIQSVASHKLYIHMYICTRHTTLVQDIPWPN